MFRKHCLFLSVFGFLVILSCPCATVLGAEQGMCGSEGISVVNGVFDEKPVTIRYAGQAMTTKWGTQLLDTRKVHDKRGNAFLFVKLTEGGSCGDGGLLVTTSNGRLLTYDFEGTCGWWEIIDPNKIVFHTVWMDICGLGWCHACGPSYPIMWTIDDCRNDKIVTRRYKNIREVYSDPDGKLQVENMLKDLRQRILRGEGEKRLSALSNPLEKEFCTRVARADEGDRTFELLFAADRSIRDRFYFFGEPKRKTGNRQKQGKP